MKTRIKKAQTGAKVIKKLPHVKYKSNYDKDLGKGAWDKEYSKQFPGKPVPKIVGTKKKKYL